MQAASGKRQAASGKRQAASGPIICRLRFLAVVAAVALFSFIPLEQSQAQLVLTINPLQGDTNNTTIWTFSGSTTPELSSSIATPSDNSNHFGSQGSLYPFARTTGTQFLTTNAPARYNAAANHSLTANTYRQPQITTPFGTRTISHLRLQNNASSDTLGFRVAGSSALNYTNGAAVSWNGQGTLPYPIGDFSLTADSEYFYGGPPFVDGYVNGSLNIPISWGLRVVVSSAPASLVPEPEEYALVFGLIALGFVFFHRHRQKKQRQATAAITS